MSMPGQQLRVAKYIGGPLDGKHARKLHAGRWPKFRGENGRVFHSADGWKEWKEGGKVYARTYTLDNGRLAVVYVHRSVWANWRRF